MGRFCVEDRPILTDLLAMEDAYTRLKADYLVATLERLSLRIHERFPGSGLHGVNSELTNLARLAQKRAEEIARPDPVLRWGVWVIVLMIGAPLAYAATALKIGAAGGGGLLELAQGLEALISLLVLVGGAVLFLATVEQRVKRKQVLEEIHRLRAICHVIDMHQLTKDPAALNQSGKTTKHSPKREMTEFELTRYLDYCSEMLSLTSKVAMLYAQELDDVAIEQTVNDLEQLTTNMSHKIWQKIMILNRLTETTEARDAQPGPDAHQREATLEPVSEGA